MRRFILSAFALFAASVTANAVCVDTLYLTDLTVLHMSVVNSKVRGNWDTTSLDPWNEGDLSKANSVNLGDHEFVYYPHSRTATHPRTIYYKCDADSHSVIEYVTVSDSFFADTRGNNAKSTSLVTSTSALSLVLSKTTGFVFNGATKYFATLYLDDKKQTFSVGRRLSTDSLRSWSSNAMAFYFDSNTAPNVLVDVGGYLPGALEDYAESTPDNALSALGSYVDKISAKTVDSTRMETKVFRYTYSYSKSVTAIRSLAANPRRFSVRASAQGVEIQMDRQARVSIVGLNGSVAKAFTARSGSTLWDGRDAFGRKLTGIWIVRAEGMGAVPVMVR
jgi:hypothetical protein